MMRVFIFATIVALLSTGCASSVPRDANDCYIAPYKQMWEEKGKTAEDCKLASVEREDRRFRKEMEEAEEEREARLCMLEGRAYDKRMRACTDFWNKGRMR